MKAIVTVGIPASGKSTYAESLKQSHSIISLDDCRFLVCGDESNQSVTKEAITLRDMFIKTAFSLEDDIILPDTNLNPVHRAALIKMLKGFGYTVELVVFNTPFETCVERNLNRERIVPHHVMVRMRDMLQMHYPVPSEADFYTVVN